MNNIKYELVNFCELDKYAEQSYCAIHDVDKSLNLGDITKVNEKEIADFNMMIGGSPCQDFSIAGKQGGAMWTCKDCIDEESGENYSYNPLEVHHSKRDKCPNCGSTNIEKTRSSLLVEWLRILSEKKPNIALYENVKNIIGKKFKKTFDLFIAELQEYGYNIYCKVLNAKDYGVPQNRERVYLIAIRKDVDNCNFKFPEPSDKGLRLKDFLENEVDESFYLPQEKVDKLLSQIKSKNTLMFDTSQSKREEYLREYNDFSPTLNSRDYKEPRLVNQSVNIIGKLNSSQDGVVVSINGIAPTHTAGHGNCPKILENKVIQVGNIVDTGSWDNPQVDRVYDADGCSPTLSTMQGGSRQPKILQTPRDFNKGGSHNIAPTISSHSYECNNFVAENNPIETPCAVASRGRYVDGILETEQQFEINTTGNTNCLTSVAKDNYILEEPQTLHPERTEYGKQIRKQYEKGEIKESRHNMTELKLRTDGVCGTLTTVQKDNYLYEPQMFRIRKLSPLECFRLMGFSDENFAKAKTSLNNTFYKGKDRSSSQLYKMAGNSIVTDVLFYIFLELHKAVPHLMNDIKLGSFFSGIGAPEVALDRLIEYIEMHNESSIDCPKTIVV